MQAITIAFGKLALLSFFLSFPVPGTTEKDSQEWIDEYIYIYIFFSWFSNGYSVSVKNMAAIEYPILVMSEQIVCWYTVSVSLNENSDAIYYITIFLCRNPVLCDSI